MFNSLFVWLLLCTLAHLTSASTEQSPDNAEPPVLVCPEFDCNQCRINNDKCKWCNRGGDSSCVARAMLCPSLYANGDDSIPCGQEPATTPRNPANQECETNTCVGCMPVKGCTFCSRGGAWACIAQGQQCPDNLPSTDDAGVCSVPVCEPSDCGGRGVCEFDTLRLPDIELVGRPTCVCDVGFKPHATKGCVPDSDTLPASGVALGVCTGAVLALATSMA